ncbi:MAG: hypothetical protein ACXVI3_02990 [Halobacteriota archaeon]
MNASVYLLVSSDNANWSIAQGTSATPADGNGTITFTQSRVAGTYCFKAYYAGNAQYKEAFCPTTQVVVKAM